jgi:hypothetical protein
MTQKTVKANLTSKATEGERTVTVIATAPTLDRDYDVIDTKSMRIPLRPNGNVLAKNLNGSEMIDVPFMLNHSSDITDIIGSTRKAFINTQGELEMQFGLADTEKANAVWPLLEGDHLGNNVSITYRDYEPINGVLYNGELVEVSLVYRGSNTDARVVAVSKALGIDVENTTEVQEENNKDKVSTEVDAADTADEVEKENTNMTNNQEVALETAVEKAVVVEQPKRVQKASKNEIRKNFVSQMSAVNSRNLDALSKFAKEGAALDGNDNLTKVLDASNIYLSEVVSNDIKAAYVDAGGVGSLVTRVDISGATMLRQVVETSGVGFQAVALGGVKPEDAPVWTDQQIIPYEWALIVVWRDGDAAQTPIAVYQQIVRYIADEYRKLEDKIILDYAGGMVGSENRPATGLVPLLEAAHRSSTIATNYNSATLIPALGTAFANIKSNAALSVVVNKVTWAKLATSLDGENNPVFKMVGQQVTAGALGTFNVVTSEKLANDEVVVGAFKDYTLVTRGSLSTLFSQEATVGSTNLFTQNASGLRASVDMAGAAVPVTSFWLLTGAGYVS